ncbi:hypothetical protein K440DRAFT_354878 [Wilcoxina mikolae CBS 423.85]|nr:hypothetical protein K440DRAFT_354878 [Wilcoxina mikolae CBS 423.85]
MSPRRGRKFRQVLSARTQLIGNHTSFSCLACSFTIWGKKVTAGTLGGHYQTNGFWCYIQQLEEWLCVLLGLISKSLAHHRTPTTERPPHQNNFLFPSFLPTLPTPP